MSRTKKNAGPDIELSRGILAVIVVILAIVIGLSFVEKAGAVGIILDQYVLSFLFGEMRFATPIILLIFAYFLIKDVDYDYRPTHGIGSVIFFLALSSLLHIGYATDMMWQMALDGNGGGVFGMFAWPLKTYLGNIAAFVVLFGMALVSIFLLFNTALTHFVMLNRKIFSGLGFIGRAVLGTFGIFTRQDSKNKVKISGGYEEEEEEYEEVEEGDEDDEEKRFAIKAIGGAQNEISKTEEKKPLVVSGDHVGAEDREPESTPWTKKVIIKDLPPLMLLSDRKSKPTSGDIEANAEIIRDTFSEFNIEVDMSEIRVGPTVTQYTLKPAKGVKLSRITGLSNDLSLALAAHPIRIEAPIPGKPLVGIEVPNHKAALVTVRELLESREFENRQHNFMIALGKDVAGKVWFADLPRMPHLLVAGATGSGKTVCVNTIIMSLLYQNTAETLRFIMVDPKRVELTLYNGIPHLLTPVITNVQKTVNALKWTIGEMDRRFEMLAANGSRDIGSYNLKHPDKKIPYIVFVIDELADLMAMAANEVEAGIIRLAQMARAVGIHLIVATQRPSVDVITGLMKANIPARIAFSVASVIDSRTILDCPGAEKLLGRGDMLLLTAELSKPVRIQGAFVAEEELKGVVEYLKGDETPEYDESIVGKQADNTNSGVAQGLFGGSDDGRDPLFEEAKRAIVQAGKASASFLQRRLKVGYSRAARLLDELENAGVIGPGDGAKPRELLVTSVDVEDAGHEAGGEVNVFVENEEDDGMEDDDGAELDNEDTENEEDKTFEEIVEEK